MSLHCAAEIRIDVAELSGYGYHNGAVFAVYPEHGRAAQGGRYDGVGEAFGRARSHRLRYEFKTIAGCQ